MDSAAPSPRPLHDGGPLSGLYHFVRSHLLVANNVVLASTLLVGALDFLAPRLSVAPLIAYSFAAALLAAMVGAAIAPALAARLISAAGFRAGRPAVGVWREPAWQFCVAILAGVCVVGFASVARASQGGLIASSVPAARSLQESMLGLRADVADIRAGVESANSKLDAMAQRSADPQRDLASLGYPYDDHGLLRAVKQADRRALGLFVQAGYKAEDRIPMLNILGGDFAWPADAVAMLPRSMFANPAACDDAGFLMSRLKAPAAERVQAFKRLCPVGKPIDALRKRIELDRAIPAASEGAAENYEARKRTLAILEG